MLSSMVVYLYVLNIPIILVGPDYCRSECAKHIPTYINPYTFVFLFSYGIS